MKNKRNQLLSLAPSTYFTIQCASQRWTTLSSVTTSIFFSHNQGLAYSWGPGQYGPWRPCCLRVSPTGVARLVVAGSQWSEAVKKKSRSLVRQGTPGLPLALTLQCPSNVRLACLKLTLASSSRVLYASLQHTSNQTQKTISVCACSKSYTHFNVCLSPPLIMSDDYCIVLPVNQKSEHLVAFPATLIDQHFSKPVYYETTRETPFAPIGSVRSYENTFLSPKKFDIPPVHKIYFIVLWTPD